MKSCGTRCLTTFILFAFPDPAAESFPRTATDGKAADGPGQTTCVLINNQKPNSFSVRI